MFTTSQYRVNNCECGIPLSFNLIRPLKEKLADIVSFQIVNNIATLTTKIVHSIIPGTDIEVINNTNIPNIIANKFTVLSVTSNTVSFIVKASDRITTNAIGYIYSIPNIESRNQYIIKYSTELTVPDSAEVTISPDTYTIESSSNFIPETVVKIISKFTTSSKSIIKLSIIDIFNQLLYTEYQQIICSQSSEKPCEILSKKPFVPTSIYLNRKNNWTYQHNGFFIAQFIPNKNIDYKNLSLILEKQNDAILPSATSSDKLVLKIDPIVLESKGITRAVLKSTILNNPISASQQENINIEDTLNNWIIQGSSLTTDQLKSIVIVSFKDGTSIRVGDIGDVKRYIPKPQPIPATMFLQWYDSDNNIEYQLGQIIYDLYIYENKNLTINFMNNSKNIKLINFVAPNYETYNDNQI